MTIHAIDSWIKRILPVFLLTAFFVTAFNAVEHIQIKNVWTVGDWLINYQGGFVRRGLFGEALLWLGNVLSIHPSYLVLGVYLLCYGMFFWFSYLLLIGQKNILPFVFLIVSPFIFLFQIHDAQGGFRKEIIIFALLAWLVYVAKTKSLRKLEFTFYFILALYPLIILTHEMLAIWLPYFVIVFLLRAKITLQRTMITAFLIAISLVAFWVSFQNPGDMLTAVKIALALSPDGSPWLGGAIRALARDMEYAQQSVAERIAENNYISFYLGTIFLVFLAFIPVRALVLQIFKNPLVLILFGISVGGTLLLAMLAHDWGRFIYIHAVSIFLLVLLVGGSVENNTKKAGLSKLRVAILAGMALAYAVVWYLPHYGLDSNNISKSYLLYQIPF